jgi:hypothetical protein
MLLPTDEATERAPMRRFLKHRTRTLPRLILSSSPATKTLSQSGQYRSIDLGQSLAVATMKLSPRKKIALLAALLAAPTVVDVITYRFANGVLALLLEVLCLAGATCLLAEAISVSADKPAA